MKSALAILAALTTPAIAKDMSRVPYHGHQDQVILIPLTCMLFEISTKNPKKRTTRKWQHLGNCSYAPSIMDEQKISWGNVFKERAEAKECGRKPFILSPCRPRLQVELVTASISKPEKPKKKAKKKRKKP